MLTQKKLRKFIERRNKSQFQTNLQFELDLRAEDIRFDELGPAKRTSHDQFEWATSFGKLVERHGKLSLLDDSGSVVFGYLWLSSGREAHS